MTQEPKQDIAPVTPTSAAEPASPVKKRRGRPTLKEAQERRTRQDQADFLIGCTVEERAYAVRLVRLIRTNYWLSNFALQILRLEAESPYQVSIEKVQEQLDKISTLEDLIGRIQFIGSNPGNYFRDHPIVRAVMEEWGDGIFEYRSEKAVRNAIESAKKEQVKS